MGFVQVLSILDCPLNLGHWDQWRKGLTDFRHATKCMHRYGFLWVFVRVLTVSFSESLSRSQCPWDTNKMKQNFRGRQELQLKLRSLDSVINSCVWEGSEVGFLAVLAVGHSPGKINQHFTVILGSVLGPSSASLCHRDGWASYSFSHLRGKTVFRQQLRWTRAQMQCWGLQWSRGQQACLPG